MGLVQPDFSEEVKPAKPGTYRAKLVSAEQRIGKVHGTPYINWKFSVLTNAGLKTSYYSSPIQGKGVNMFRRVLEAFNPNYNGEQVDMDKLVGRTVVVDLVDQIDPNTGRKGPYLEITNFKVDSDRTPFPEPGRGFDEFGGEDISFP